MAQINHSVDVNDLEQVFDPIPAGVYQVVIDSSDVAPTKDGKGTIAKFTYQIIENGKYKGRKLFEVINLDNKSASATEIGRKKMNGLCVACNFTETKLSDTVQLHGRPLFIRVGLTGDTQYPNKVLAHLSTTKQKEEEQKKEETKSEKAEVANAGVDNNNAPVKRPWEK